MSTPVSPTSFDRIRLRPLANLRDVGGHATRDGGRVRTGVAFRSTDLSRLAAVDTAVLERLGIRTVYDLRTEPERTSQPEVQNLPSGTAYVVADVLEVSPGGSPAHLFAKMQDIDAVRELFADGRSDDLFVDKYREFVMLPSARTAFRRLFEGLAGGDDVPALFHCTTGKDRTGWAAAALLLLLGVSEEAVMADYLASNEHLAEEIRGFLDVFRDLGGDPAWIEPLMGVRSDYLEAGLDEMRREFGDVEGYFGDGLGIDAAAQVRLRERFLGA